jgi:hypothetical protein
MAWLRDARSLPAMPFIAKVIKKLSKKYLKEYSKYLSPRDAGLKVVLDALHLVCLICFLSSCFLECILAAVALCVDVVREGIC